MATVKLTKKQQSNVNKYASDSVKKAFGYNASTGTATSSSATPSRSSSGGSSGNSYKDVTIVTQENVNRPEEGVTRVSLVDSNSGRTIRTLKANESINFTPYSSSTGLNQNEMRMTGEAGRQLKAGTFGQTPNALTRQMQSFNTINILQSSEGKASGLEYQGKSYTTEGFQKEFGVKVLYDPTKKDYFFGTVGTPEAVREKRPSTISAGFTLITKEERKQVSDALLKANINVVATSFNKKAVQVGKDYTYDFVTSKTTAKLGPIAKAIKERATYTLNNSDFKTGNKAIDLTTKSLGGISYFVGSAGAYGLNMISGLGNLAAGLTLKPKETTKQIVINSPEMLKGAFMEIGRTVTGQGTIEDFFGAALTLSTIGSATSKFAQLVSKYKTGSQLGRDAMLIKSAVRDSKALLKKEQLYYQKIMVKNSNSWDTFGKAQQKMAGMDATHSWVSLTRGKVSMIIQKSVIENKNVRMVNFMGAQSTADKLYKFMGLLSNRKVAFMETYANTNKISTYLSKIKARRMYTLVEVRGSKFVTAIDGAGNVKLLKSYAEVNNFMRNAKFGKFSFTGKKGIGGNVETLLKVGKKDFVGSESFTKFGFRKTAGVSVVKKYVTAEQKFGGNMYGGKIGTKLFKKVKEMTMTEWRASTQKAVANLKKYGKENPSELKALAKDLDRVYNSKGITDAAWKKSTQKAVKNLEKWAKKNPQELKALVKDLNTVYKPKQMSMTAWRKSTQKSASNLKKWGRENPERVKALVKDLNKVYSNKGMSKAAWQRSVNKAVKDLKRWGKNNPSEVKALVKDLNKLYKPKQMSMAQWRRSTAKAGRDLEKWGRSNPDKVRALARDLEEINSPNGMVQLVRGEGKSKMAKLSSGDEIGLSKQVSSSVVSSQLKNVVKAIDKAIGDNKIALRNGYTAVAGRTGLLFLSKNGGIVSAKVATTATTSQVDRVQNKVKQVISNATSNKSANSQKNSQRQSQSQASAQKSAQQQKQQQRQMQKQGTTTSQARANFNMKVKEKIRFPSSGNDGDKDPRVRRILGNKIAPSYQILLGSGKKVKRLSGRYSAKDAISRSAYVVDRTQQRTVRIVPTKQRPNAKFSRNYLNQAGRKFRNYRIKGGKKVSYSSTRLIEKRKYFNDIKGETPRKRRRK